LVGAALGLRDGFFTGFGVGLTGLGAGFFGAGLTTGAGFFGAGLTGTGFTIGAGLTGTGFTGLTGFEAGCAIATCETSERQAILATKSKIENILCIIFYSLPISALMVKF
jgi:hypothetical protein